LAPLVSYHVVIPVFGEATIAIKAQEGLTDLEVLDIAGSIIARHVDLKVKYQNGENEVRLIGINEFAPRGRELN
jgi:uncharacterized protein with ACT and thioredoxin-like domain